MSHGKLVTKFKQDMVVFAKDMSDAWVVFGIKHVDIYPICRLRLGKPEAIFLRGLVLQGRVDWFACHGLAEAIGSVHSEVSLLMCTLSRRVSWLRIHLRCGMLDVFAAVY